MTFISYAQNFEDVLLWRALGHVKNGFYIDVGANDPLEHSVTAAFYQRGWYGINIEPLAQYQPAYAAQRPRDINLCLAAGAEDGQTTLFDVPAVPGWASPDPAVASAHRHEGHEVVGQTVPVRTLRSICAEHVERDIHFLKIDVEGWEEQVLLGMDFQRWRPWVLVVEATLPNSRETNHANWEALVLAARYQFAYFDGLNRYYVADEHPELRATLTVQANVFDDFVSIHLSHAWQAGEAARQRAADAEGLLENATLRVQRADQQARAADLQNHISIEQARAAEAAAQRADAHAQACEARAQAADAAAHAAALHAQAATSAAEATMAAAHSVGANALAHAEQCVARAQVLELQAQASEARAQALELQAQASDARAQAAQAQAAESAARADQLEQRARECDAHAQSCAARAQLAEQQAAQAALAQADSARRADLASARTSEALLTVIEAQEQRRLAELQVQQSAAQHDALKHYAHSIEAQVQRLEAELQACDANARAVAVWADDLQQQLHSSRASMSWRLAAPLRWLEQQHAQLFGPGPLLRRIVSGLRARAGRAKRALLRRVGANALVRDTVLRHRHRFPALAARLQRVAAQLREHPPVQQHAELAPLPQPVADLPSSARKVLADLERAQRRSHHS